MNSSNYGLVVKKNNSLEIQLLQHLVLTIFLYPVSKKITLFEEPTTKSYEHGLSPCMLQENIVSAVVEGDTLACSCSHVE